MDDRFPSVVSSNYTAGNPDAFNLVLVFLPRRQLVGSGKPYHMKKRAQRLDPSTIGKEALSVSPWC
jgi:hypothetical protein